MSLLTEKIQWV